MMNELRLFIGLMLLGALVSSFSQLLLKTSAQKEHPSFLKQYLNLRVIAAYGLLLTSTAASLTAFRVVPLSYAPVADAAALVFTVLLSSMVLKERLSFRKAAGMLVVAAGIIIIVV